MKQVEVIVAQELSGHDAVVIKVYAMHIMARINMSRVLIDCEC